MKNHTCSVLTVAIGILLLPCLPCHTQTAETPATDRLAVAKELLTLRAKTVQEAQAIAVEKIPALAVLGSIENVLFRGIYSRIKSLDDLRQSGRNQGYFEPPSVFADPNWPLVYARRIAELGNDIRRKLLGGTMSGDEICFFVALLKPDQLKIVLGPPGREYNGQWGYGAAALNPVTEKREDLWLYLESGSVLEYSVGSSDKKPAIGAF